MSKVKFEKPLKALGTINIVKNALDADGLKYQFIEESAVAFLKIVGTKYTYDVMIFCADEFVTVQMRYPFFVPRERISSLLPFLNSINIQNPVGSLELLKDNITLCVKVGVSIKNFVPDAKLIIEALSRAFEFTDSIVDDIERVIFHPQ